jgi:hypothetical protein
MPQASPLTDQAIRDTLAAVFEHRGYDRTLRQTLTERIWAWLAELFGPLQRSVEQSPIAQRIALALLVLLGLAVVARALVLAHGARVARAMDREGRGARGAGGRLSDPWMEAQRLAGLGDYTGAAHASYAAVLSALARRARVRLHPSKTVGDYHRDLRRVQSPLAPRYREYAQLYEVVVYGVGTCDADRWHRLHALAAELVERERAAA